MRAMKIMIEIKLQVISLQFVNNINWFNRYCLMFEYYKYANMLQL